MTNDAISQCFTLLSVMNSGSEQRWRDELKPVYALVLRTLDDATGKAAVEWAVLHEEWRPSPARLRKIAAQVASPYPSAEDAYAELMDKATRIGLFGKPDPINPNVFDEGPPPMSHPVVGRIVAHLGGWRMLCEGEAQMQEGLKKQVASSHSTAAGQWEEEVAVQLTLPPERRNQSYFKPYEPYRPVVPMTELEMLALPPPPVRLDESLPPPEPIRKLIACIKSLGDEDERTGRAVGSKWTMPPEERRGQTLLRDFTTREERDRHLAEVRAAQASPKYRLPEDSA